MTIKIAEAQLNPQGVHDLQAHLTDRHRQALRAYVSDIMPDDSESFGYFDRLNTALRASTGGLPFQVEVTSGLDEACSLFALSEPITVWRGIGLSEVELVGLRNDGLKDAAYCSCSTEIYVAERFARASAGRFKTAVVLEVHLHVGQQVLPRDATDMECEILLPRAVSLRPSETGELRDGIWIIPVNIVTP